MGRVFWICCCLLGMLCCAPTAQGVEAEEISGKALVADHAGFSSVNMLFDGRTMESVKIRKGGHITLESDSGIGSVYLVFGREPGTYTVTDDAARESRTFGESGFLHEFLNLEGVFGCAPQRVTITFADGDTWLNELSAFTAGLVPDWVQQWEPPVEEADLVLFSTHGDDEQLFFAGMLPYYARELGYQVQVVYLTGHRNMTIRRTHEMLDGLWAVGIRNYPVFGPFGDYNSQSLGEAYGKYRQKGITQEALLSFVVENIRRFRPKVAVGHDLQGEYGHGMHMLYADLLCQAVEISGDREAFQESADLYGCWDVPKTYLHLYPENEIWMDWDIPLESFDGMTAFEVTKNLGFPCHVSQQSYYSWYFQGMHSAAEIPEYSPCAFGLYRSTVGEDVEKRDFFENVTTYQEDALAEARLLAEEAARREAEKQSATQPATHPETVPVETEAPNVPAKAEKTNLAIPLILSGAVILAIILLIILHQNRRKTGSKK